MANSFVVDSSMVSIRRVLSGLLVVLAISLAGVALAGSVEDLIDAAYKGDLKEVKVLLDKGANVNAKPNTGVTALMVASQNGHKDVVQLLLDKGAEVNAKDINGLTALYSASQNGHKDVVQLLLNKGASVNAKDISGLTAFYSATQNDHKDIVQLLLGKVAEVNAKDNDGIGPQKSWTATKNPPTAIYSIGWDTVLLSNGSLLGIGWAISGRHSLAFFYDATANEWSQTGDVPDGTGGFNLTKLPNGKVLAIGVDINRNTVALLFDPASKQWYPTGPLPSKTIDIIPRIVVLPNENVLVLRSSVLNSTVNTAGWLYNYKNNTWSVTQSIPIQINGFIYATNIANGQVLAIATDHLTLTEKWIGMLYDPTNNSWALTGDIPTAMHGNNINNNQAAVLSDGSVFVTGYQSYPALPIVLYFNPKINTWSIAGTLPKDTLDIKVVKALPDGNVLAITGVMQKIWLTGLLYNPANDKWVSTDFMPTDVLGINFINDLPNGTLWAIGRKNNLFAEELIYSPTTKSWTSVRNLPNGITHVSPLLRENGAALLFTGPNSDTRSGIDNAVLFTP